jgi:hypothetical protein
MLNTGFAALCAAIAWAIAFQRIAVVGEPDPFGFDNGYARAGLIGGGLVACLAVARYLTYRPGRGLRIGLANFMLVSAGLVAFFSVLFFVQLGGDVTDAGALADYAARIAATYGVCAFASFAAFLSCELLLAHL